MYDGDLRYVHRGHLRHVVKYSTEMFFIGKHLEQDEEYMSWSTVGGSASCIRWLGGGVRLLRIQLHKGQLMRNSKSLRISSTDLHKRKEVHSPLQSLVPSDASSPRRIRATHVNVTQERHGFMSSMGRAVETYCKRVVGPSLYSRIVDNNHTFAPGYSSYAGDNTSAWYRLGVDAMCGQ